MKSTATEAAPKVTTQASQVDLHATMLPVNPLDGPARRLPSPYECTLDMNKMRGYTINVAKAVTGSASLSSTIHTPNEWHIGSKSGTVVPWRNPGIRVEATVHIIVIYVRDVRMDIARRGWATFRLVSSEGHFYHEQDDN